MSDFWWEHGDDIKITVTVLLIVLLAIVACVGTVSVTYYMQCRDLETVDEIHEYRWSFWSSCRVRTPSGYWVDVDDNPYLLELDDGS